MCGRFTLTASPEALAAAFELESGTSLAPRYNVAPGDDVATVGRDAGVPRRRLVLRRWGLVPPWADDPRVGFRMINARSETVLSRPAFREAFRRRRCLVPADGFFEWGAGDDGRRPYHVTRPDRALFAMAGLWERWRAPDGALLESCAILTTRANARVRAIHDRMPAILDSAVWDRWLDPGVREPRELVPLLRPAPEDWLAITAVSRYVNDARHDDPACLEPLPS